MNKIAAEDCIITKVMVYYYPEWEPPVDNGREWVSTNCPVHGDSTPSAGVNYRKNSFNCLACGYSGDWIKIIMNQEGMNYTRAVEFAQATFNESGEKIRGESARKSSRGIPFPKRFGES